MFLFTNIKLNNLSKSCIERKFWRVETYILDAICFLFTMLISLARLEFLIPEIDENSDGRLSFDEMLSYTRRGRTLIFSKF